MWSCTQCDLVLGKRGRNGFANVVKNRYKDKCISAVQSFRGKRECSSKRPA